MFLIFFFSKICAIEINEIQFKNEIYLPGSLLGKYSSIIFYTKIKWINFSDIYTHDVWLEIHDEYTRSYKLLQWLCSTSIRSGTVESRV